MCSARAMLSHTMSAAVESHDTVEESLQFEAVAPPPPMQQAVTDVRAMRMCVLHDFTNVYHNNCMRLGVENCVDL